MQEPEVSLLIALHYIRNGLTDDNVKVSIDGAHIRTGETVHFNIAEFLTEHYCRKVNGDADRWQGVYDVEGYEQKVIIDSRPGEGDVVIRLPDGNRLYVESKKVRKGKSNHEYPAMREAIGQLMTGCEFTKNVIPAVAVPYTYKSAELAERWSKLPQIEATGIRFILVHENGAIHMI